MRDVQMVGGIFALLLGVMFVGVLLNDLLIGPSQGISGADSANPAKILPAVAAAPILLLGFWLQIGIAAALVVTIQTLDVRLRDTISAPVQIATAAGTAAVILFLAAGMLGLSGEPSLASLYSQNASAAGTAFVADAVVGRGLINAAIFATGAWALLVNWAVIQRGEFPRVLGYLGLLFGLASIGAFVVAPLNMLGGLIGIVWSVWLGMELLRKPGPAR